MTKLRNKHYAIISVHVIILVTRQNQSRELHTIHQTQAVNIVVISKTTASEKHQQIQCRKLKNMT